MKTPVPIVRVVDNDVSFLTSIARILRASGFVVETFASAAKFLARSKPDAPGCVILDLNMPGLTGLDLQIALAKERDVMPVIFLSGHGDVLSAVQAMRRGAEDFLTKRTPKGELIAAVKRALARDTRERAERVRLVALRAPFAALTPRKREVLTHVLTGRLNKQIAGDLGIDERSVKRHRTGIMIALQVKSVAELTNLVRDAGLWNYGQLTQ